MNDVPKRTTTALTPRKRLSYWFVDRILPRHKEIATALLKKGYEIRFFTTPASFFGEARVRRAGIVLIDDMGSKSQIETVIQGCIATPELQGVRLILTTSGQQNPELRQLAAWGAFRDIISLELPDAQFVRRFVFSTAGKSLPLPIPVPHLAANQISAINAPIRVVWISEKKIRIEGRLCPPVGTLITLQGALAESMGAPAISVTVEELHRSFLQYRFSDAVVGTWNVSDPNHEKIRQTLDLLRAKNVGQRRRVFVAAQSNAFRNEIVNYLRGPHFEVKAALQKQSIVDEPRFFNPDVIFMEDSLCRDGDADRLKAMVQGVSNNLTVIVKGTMLSRETLQKSIGHHHLVIYQHIPNNIGEIVLNKYANGSHRHAGLSGQEAIHVQPDDKNSFAILRVAARLTRIHPFAVQLALPFPVGNFGICRIESPILTKSLGRSPFAKITGYQTLVSTEPNPFTHAIDCHLADTSKEERRILALALANYLADQLTHSLAANAQTDDDAAVAPNTGAQVAPIAVAPHLRTAMERQEVREEKVPTKIRVKKKTNPFEPLKYVAAFVAVAIGFGMFIWLVVKISSTEYEKSGGEYTNSLKKMAPDKFRNEHVDPAESH